MNRKTLFSYNSYSRNLCEYITMFIVIYALTLIFGSLFQISPSKEPKPNDLLACNGKSKLNYYVGCSFRGVAVMSLLSFAGFVLIIILLIMWKLLLEFIKIMVPITDTIYEWTTNIGNECTNTFKKRIHKKKQHKK